MENTPYLYETLLRVLGQHSNWLDLRDCSESTGLLLEDVYRKVRGRTFDPGGQSDVRSR